MLSQPGWEKHPWCPGCCSSSAARERDREKTLSGAGRATAGTSAPRPSLGHLCSLAQSHVGEVKFRWFLAAGGFPVELRRQQRMAEHRSYQEGPKRSRGRGEDPAEVIPSSPAWAIDEREAKREGWRSNCCSETLS